MKNYLNTIIRITNKSRFDEETLNKIVKNIKKLEQKRQKESIKNFKMEKYKVYGINK